MRPETLGERLVVHGLRQAGEEPGMAVDLLTLPQGVPLPRGVIIERASLESMNPHVGAGIW
jgi:hypothetical protein